MNYCATPFTKTPACRGVFVLLLCNHMQWHPKNIQEFHAIVPEILDVVIERYRPHADSRACVVCLSADLGGGKTTFAQGVGRILGIREPIQSPTFVIRKSYMTSDPLMTHMVHIDAYRIAQDDSLDMFNFPNDFEQPHSIVMIEWPSAISQVIPDHAISITIEHAGDGRVITIE